MKKFAGAAASVLLMAAAGSASAAVTVGSPNATTGSLVFVDLTVAANKNLSNDGFYSSANPNIAYLFYEGVNDYGQETFLLHFDRKGRFLSTGEVKGSFTFTLGALDQIDDVLTTKEELDDSDDLDNGVTYARCSGAIDCLFHPAAYFRGLEPQQFPIFNDYVQLTPDIQDNPNGPIFTVNYYFKNDQATMDEVRFTFSHQAAVPEPAAWALMISGFGMAGGLLRRRRMLTA